MIAMGDPGRGGGAEDAALIPGTFFLVEERTPEFAYEMFNSSVADGKPGLVITRDLPLDIRRKYSLLDVPMVWLTHLVGNDHINPTSIGLLLSRITSFIDRNQQGIVLLDGVEYLISQNSYDRILQFIHQVRDMVLVGGGTMIMPLDTRVLEEKQLALLERNLEVIMPSTKAAGRRFVFELEDGLLKVMKENAR